METSAKTGRNVETIFHAIGKAIHNQWEWQVDTTQTVLLW